MDYEAILNTKLDNDDFDKELTIKGYLRLLLWELWNQTEAFSGKRPFGNSGWEYDLFIPLVANKFVEGSIDSFGFLEDVDEEAANALVFDLIDYCFKQNT